MAIVDADLKFLYVDMGTNGRMNDAGVWAKCQMSNVLSNGDLNLPLPQLLPGSNIVAPFVMVDDDAFPLGIHMMKPYSGNKLDQCERIFNYR